MQFTRSLVIYIEYQAIKKATLTCVSEFRKECVKLLQEWEDMAKKMVHFSNHRCFTLRLSSPLKT